MYHTVARNFFDFIKGYDCVSSESQSSSRLCVSTESLTAAAHSWFAKPAIWLFLLHRASVGQSIKLSVSHLVSSLYKQTLHSLNRIRKALVSSCSLT